MTFRYQIKGELCDEQTRKDLKEYWEMRKRDLEMFYMPINKTAEEMAEYLQEEYGYDLESPDDYEDELGYEEYLYSLIDKCRHEYDLYMELDRVDEAEYPPERYMSHQRAYLIGKDRIRFIFECGSEHFLRAEYWYIDGGSACYIDITDTELAEAIWDYLSDIFYDVIECKEEW